MFLALYKIFKTCHFFTNYIGLKIKSKETSLSGIQKTPQQPLEWLFLFSFHLNLWIIFLKVFLCDFLQLLKKNVLKTPATNVSQSVSGTFRVVNLRPTTCSIRLMCTFPHHKDENDFASSVLVVDRIGHAFCSFRSSTKKKEKKKKKRESYKSIETRGISIGVSYTIPRPHGAIGSRRGLI